MQPMTGELPVTLIPPTRDELVARLAVLRSKRMGLAHTIRNIDADISSITNRIHGKPVRSDPRSAGVSDHAIVRYVERVIGFSREELCEKVCPAQIYRGLRETAGQVTVPVGDTHRAVIIDGVVVTVLTPFGDDDF